MIRGLLVAVLAIVVLAAAEPGERAGKALYDAGFPQVAALLLPGPAWRGATLYAEGRYEEAAAAFEGAPFGAAPYDQGTAFARADRLTEAAAALDEALRRDPNDEDARYNLALVESLKARRENAARKAPGAADASAAEQRHSGAPAADSDVHSTGEGAAGDRDSGRRSETPGDAQIANLLHSSQSRLDAAQGEAMGSIGDADGPGRKGKKDAKVAHYFDQAVRLPKKSFAQQAVMPSVQWLKTLPDDPGQYLKLKIAAERSGRAERGVAAPERTDPW